MLDAVPSGRRLLTTRRVSAAGIVLVLAAVAAALLIAALTGGNGEHAPNASRLGRSDSASERPGVRPGRRQRGAQRRSAERDRLEPGNRVDDRDLRASPVMSVAANKPGVGLVVGTEKPVTARTMTIRSAAGGWDAQIYGSTSDASHGRFARRETPSATRSGR